MIALLVLLIILLAGFALFTWYIDAGQSTGLHSSNYSNDALKRHYKELKRHSNKWKRVPHPFYHLDLKLGDDCYPSQERNRPHRKAKPNKKSHNERPGQSQHRSINQTPASTVNVKTHNSHHGKDILMPDDIVVNADGEIKTSAEITQPSYEDIRQEVANSNYDNGDTMPLVDPSIIEIEEQSNALTANQAEEVKFVASSQQVNEAAKAPTPTKVSQNSDRTNGSDSAEKAKEEPTSQSEDNDASWSEMENALESLLMNKSK